MTPSAELAPIAADSALALPKVRLFQMLEACLACATIEELRKQVIAMAQLGPPQGVMGKRRSGHGALGTLARPTAADSRVSFVRAGQALLEAIAAQF